MAAALVKAAVDHDAEAVNLQRSAICEHSSDPNRYSFAVEALLQARDLHYAHPHGCQGCQFARPGI